MGTNYYLRYDCCERCGRADEQRHIGKSSFGWCFSLHVEDELNSLDDWKREFQKPNTRIYDEYPNPVTVEEMILIITERAGAKSDLDYPNQFYRSREEMMERNSAVPGPNGLLRHKIDSKHCVGHGEGAWDYIRGEFS